MQRLIDLEGCLNFRDLGGYPTKDGHEVRWRQLFRSDALHLLTAADVARLRDVLRIGDVIDLRSTTEVRSEGRGRLGEEAIRFHHVPLYDGNVAGSGTRGEDYTLADLYFGLAEYGKDAIGRVIMTLAATTAPAIYHCAAGKDRTGVVSAILLAILGVTDEIIAVDYAATQENLDAIIERLMTTEGYRAMLDELPPETLHARPDTMMEFLDRMRTQYGSMRGYASSAGVSDETIRRLEARLLTA